MFEAVIAQAQLIAQIGAVSVCIGLRDPEFSDDLGRLGEAEIREAHRVGPVRHGLSLGLAHLLREAQLDLLHLHGIWTPCSVAATRWRKDTGKPLVISPHGMLDPWILQKNRWKKHLGRWAFENRNWKNADAFHALTGKEAAQITKIARSEEIVTIPNAAPALATPPARFNEPKALYLGRLHPKKNLEQLIAGWRSAEHDLPRGARLIIAGSGEWEYVAHLQRLADGARIDFAGPSYGNTKAQMLSDARFLVLPSLSEGLPMVVLEAWSAGLPVLMSAECNLPQGFAAGAAKPLGTSASQIAADMVQALTISPDEWSAMASAARTIATTQFGMATVRNQWESAYTRVIARHEQVIA